MIKKFKLFEEYTKQNENILNDFFDNLINMFKKIFENGDNIGEIDFENLDLLDIEKSFVADSLKKNLILNITDNQYFYQITIEIDVESDIEEGIIKSGGLIIKVYDPEQVTMLNKNSMKIDIEIPDEDEIIDNGMFFINVKKSDEEDFDKIENLIISQIGNIKIMLENE